MLNVNYIQFDIKLQEPEPEPEPYPQLMMARPVGIPSSHRFLWCSLFLQQHMPSGHANSLIRWPPIHNAIFHLLLTIVLLSKYIIIIIEFPSVEEFIIFIFVPLVGYIVLYCGEILLSLHQ